FTRAEENLMVAPSHIDLAAAEVELAGVVGRELILRDALNEVTDDFDYAIIDCPPSLGILTINALSAVSDVFLPLQPHFLALHGLSKLIETIDLVRRRLNDRLRLAGVVLCLYESGTRLAAEVTADVADFFDRAGASAGTLVSGAKLFDARIRRNIRLAEAPSFSQSIFQYAPHSHGAEDYRRLAAEVAALYESADFAPTASTESSCEEAPADNTASPTAEMPGDAPIHHDASVARTAA
ncbi:MAG: AAA family ATPase, partial [Planctomycetales bacterium]|nr:AAA family ATPase [Planctomycetales bacterium]